MVRPLLYGVLLAAAALWPTGAPHVAALTVDLAGCNEFLRDAPACVMWDWSASPALAAAGQTGQAGPDPLRLFVHLPDGVRRLSLRAPGRPLRALDAAHPRLEKIAVPQRAGRVELQALIPEGEARWSLRIERPRPPAAIATALLAAKICFSKSVSSRALCFQALAALQPRVPREPRGAVLHAMASLEPDAVRALCFQALAAQEPRAPRELRGAMLHAMASLAPDMDRQEALYRRSMAAHIAAGQSRGEADSGTALASSAIDAHRFLDARRLLADLASKLPPPAAPRDALPVLAIAYFRGVLARNVGDLRTALAELSDAAALDTRLGLLPKWTNPIGQELALTLQGLGRWPEAADTFESLRSLLPPDTDCVALGTLLSNDGWSQLMQREAASAAAPTAGAGDLPRRLLRQAESAFDSQACGRPFLRKDVRISLALAAQQAGDAAGARQALAEADRIATTPSLSPEQQLWHYEIEARLALAEHRPAAALELYGLLERLAAAKASPTGRWLAAYGQARSHRAAGDVDLALASYRAASAVLDEQSLAVPIFEGRELFLALREAGTRSYLDLLAESGRVDEAFAVARRARSRVLRQLERTERLASLPAGEREAWQQGLTEFWRRRDRLERQAAGDWQLAADALARARAARAPETSAMQAVLDAAFAVLGKGSGALPPLLPQEVTLAYYDLGGGRWLGFAGTPAGVHMERIVLPVGAALPADAPLARLLLAPFRAEIRRARRVRVLPFGALEQVDFHALPWDGDILLAARPVVYGLDLGTPPLRPAGPLRALILGDSRGDLPAARAEARDVRRALTTGTAAAAGWTAEILPADTEAGALARQFDRCDLFHYAGHAAAAGGWDGMLLLAHDTHLTLADLLALRRAPAWAVLAGCDTGRPAGGAGAAVEIPSLAHAFLLAGSRGVIAAVLPVDDQAARAFFAELYRGWAGVPDLAVELQRAQLAVRRAAVSAAADPADPAGPARSPWRSFRLFAP